MSDLGFMSQQPPNVDDQIYPTARPPGGTPPLPPGVTPRSQYLADALHQLQQTAGQNIRTPSALGTNMLADALLQGAGQMPGRRSTGNVNLGAPTFIPMSNGNPGMPTGDFFGGG